MRGEKVLLEGNDQAIKSLFDAIRLLMSVPAKPRRGIGFQSIVRETAGKSKAVARKSRRR